MYSWNRIEVFAYVIFHPQQPVHNIKIIHSVKINYSRFSAQGLYVWCRGGQPNVIILWLWVNDSALRDIFLGFSDISDKHNQCYRLYVRSLEYSTAKLALKFLHDRLLIISDRYHQIKAVTCCSTHKTDQPEIDE